MKDAEDITEFGEAYQGARKAYGVVSALLISWEFIGIEFGASPVETFNVTLKSPQAVPYVLIVLTLYFSFRFTVEWYQSDQRRRTLIVSRVDYAVAHLIGALALMLYAYQAFRNVQIANLFAPIQFMIFVVGVVLVALSRKVVEDLVAVISKQRKANFDLVELILLSSMIVIAVIGSISDGEFGALVSGVAVGLVAQWIITLIARKFSIRSGRSGWPNTIGRADG